MAVPGSTCLAWEKPTVGLERIDETGGQVPPERDQPTKSKGLRILNAIVEIGVNFVLPYAIYSAMAPQYGDVNALLAASIPPLGWSIVEFIRHRKLDALSLLVLAGIALSILAFFGGGGVRMLQLREKLVTGILGLVFLASALLGRPLIYQLARANVARKSPDQIQTFDSLKENARFRHAMMVMTVVWGVVLILDTIMASILVFIVSIKTYLIVSPIESFGVIGALSVWTAWYARLMKRRGRQAANVDNASDHPDTDRHASP